jgi:hypothetical protein
VRETIVHVAKVSIFIGLATCSLALCTQKAVKLCADKRVPIAVDRRRAMNERPSEQPAVVLAKNRTRDAPRDARFYSSRRPPLKHAPRSAFSCVKASFFPFNIQIIKKCCFIFKSNTNFP